MKLPLNPLEIRDFEQKLEQQRSAPVHVEVMLDPALDDRLIDELTLAFVPQRLQGKSSVDVLSPSTKPVPHREVDAVVIVVSSIQATNPIIGQLEPIITRLSEQAIPVIVVCSDIETARADVAALFGLNILATLVSDKPAFILDHLAGWFAETCGNLKLALAANFAWMRRHIAKEAINNTALQNGAVGLVPVFPGADLPVMTLNQAKMILEIAAAYGQRLDADRIKELLVVVGGGFAFREAARTAIGWVPMLGWAISGVIGYTGTVAMGKAALKYFEEGGTPEGLAVKLQEVRDGLVEKAQQTGKALPVDEVKSKMKALPAAAAARRSRAREDTVQAPASGGDHTGSADSGLSAAQTRRLERQSARIARAQARQQRKQKEKSGYHQLV